MLLNFPNNPTGYTPTEAEAKALTAEIRKAAEAGNQIVVVLDDAYFGLVYEEGIAQESLFGSLVDLHPNVLGVKLDGATKEDYVWGFRVGFITFGFKGANAAQLKALENKAAGVVRGNISNAPCVSQSMLLKGLYRSGVRGAKEAEIRNSCGPRRERSARLSKRIPSMRKASKSCPSTRATSCA